MSESELPAGQGESAPVGTIGGQTGVDSPAEGGEAAAPVGAIGRKAGRGLRWSLVGNLGTKLGSFTIGLILARLLAPADFGVFAVALAATAFVMHVNDIGVIAAGVQWRGKLEDMAPTGTTIAIAFSTVVYAVFFFGAPAFAALAGAPDAAPVVRLLTVIIIIDGITSCRSAALMRRFEQDRLTKATMIGMAANFVVAVPLAFAGAGAYSFAGGQVAGCVVTGILVWRMGNLPARLGFDRAVARKLLKFGIPLAASLGVESVLLNADYVIVGNVLGATALGYYLLAFNVSNWVPGLVGTAVRYVSIPSFSRLAEQEPEALAAGVRKSVPVLVSAILPVAALMAVLAPYMVVFLYGGQWGPSAYVLRFLTVLMVVRMLTSLSFDILTSLGATRSTVVLNAGWAIALIPALWFGTHLDGIRGAAIAHGIVALVVALPLAVGALHRAGVPLLPVLPALIRPAVGAVLCTGATLVAVRLIDGGVFLHLFVPGLVGLLVFVLTVVPIDQFRRLRTRLARAR
ncbi:oligosaccharide flippase family protein [Kutzneria sp. NPDC052558]|uniref:oligosaccharide flippase family protein n=1 Tax=Kutzneria sp. NPDC052558 TaxID=3364121 RepID=UPI0037C61919